MEQFSHGLITSLDCDKEVISLNKSQKHLIWWYPLASLRALFKLRKVDMVHLGDGVLARMGRCLKFFTKKPVVITVHGFAGYVNETTCEEIVGFLISLKGSGNYRCIKLND